jgi:hypothetical protein
MSLPSIQVLNNYGATQADSLSSPDILKVENGSNFTSTHVYTAYSTPIALSLGIFLSLGIGIYGSVIKNYHYEVLGYAGGVALTLINVCFLTYLRCSSNS